MNKIISLVVVVFLLTQVSAVTIYSGESVEVELDKQFDYYSVIGNSTEVILNITQHGSNVTIIPDKYSLNDTYEIIFFDKEKEVITVYSSSGGGSSGSSTTIKYVYKNRTNYVDRPVIEYKDKIVGTNEIEVEKIVEKIPSLIWGILIFFAVALIITIIFYIAERRSNRE